jgi:hypothetical protein
MKGPIRIKGVFSYSPLYIHRVNAIIFYPLASTVGKGYFMSEKINVEQSAETPPEHKEEMRTIYTHITSYINAVVTFRFTVLGFFLAGVGIILAGTQSWYKYFFLVVITICLYIIELRNRFLSKHLEAHARQIEEKWGYFEEHKNNFAPEQVWIFKRAIPPDKRKLDYAWKGLTHSFALDILYVSVFVYALVNAIILGIPAFIAFIQCLAVYKTCPFS